MLGAFFFFPPSPSPSDPSAPFPSLSSAGSAVEPVSLFDSFVTSF